MCAGMEARNAHSASYGPKPRVRLNGRRCSTISAGRKGDKRLLTVTDGCPGPAAAIRTIYLKA